MAELNVATAITTPESGDILPIRKESAAGLLKISLEQIKDFTLSDIVPKSTGGTFNGAIGVDLGTGAFPGTAPAGTFLFSTVDGSQAVTLGIAFAEAVTFVGSRAQGTRDTPTAIAEGNILAQFLGEGFADSDWTGARGGILVIANENWNATDQGTRVVIAGTLDDTDDLTVFAQFVNGAFILGGGTNIIVSAERHIQLRAYELASLPSAAVAGQLIYVSDAAEGVKLRVSNGTTWETGAGGGGGIPEAPVDSKRYVRRNEVWVELVLPYDFGAVFEDTPVADAIIGRVRLGRDIVIQVNFAGSSGGVDVNPDASFVVDVQDDGVSIGTITVDTAGAFTFDTVDGTDPTAVAAGSLITFHAPSTPDATVEGFDCVILAQQVL